jgi:hypothetical protein
METETEYEHREGRVARGIEGQTAKLPSDIFLWGALGSLAAGLVMRATGRRNDTGLFITQLAPVLLILGLYNKVVKVAGHDKVSG